MKKLNSYTTKNNKSETFTNSNLNTDTSTVLSDETKSNLTESSEDIIKIPFFNISDLSVNIKCSTIAYIKKLKISCIVSLCTFVIGIIATILFLTLFPYDVTDLGFNSFLKLISVCIFLGICLFSIYREIYSLNLIKKFNKNGYSLFYPIYNSEPFLTILTQENIYTISSNIPCPICSCKTRFYFQKSDINNVVFIVCDYAGSSHLHIFAINLIDLKKYIDKYKGDTI